MKEELLVWKSRGELGAHPFRPQLKTTYLPIASTLQLEKQSQRETHLGVRLQIAVAQNAGVMDVGRPEHPGVATPVSGRLSAAAEGPARQVRLGWGLMREARSRAYACALMSSTPTPQGRMAPGIFKA